MGKLVDVDDVINAIKAIPRLILDPKGEFQPVEPPTKGMIDPDDAISAIENLPSAQPERTCVNCGRTANNGGWYADGRTRCPIEEHYALPKDGFCHL